MGDLGRWNVDEWREIDCWAGENRLQINPGIMMIRDVCYRAVSGKTHRIKIMFFRFVFPWVIIENRLNKSSYKILFRGFMRINVRIKTS